MEEVEVARVHQLVSTKYVQQIGSRSALIQRKHLFKERKRVIISGL